MVWTSANGPKCPVSREDRGEFMKPRCKYCEGQGPSRGFLWTENNGPIVACPICNAEYDTPKAKREREYDQAKYQRLKTAQEKSR